MLGKFTLMVTTATLLVACGNTGSDEAQGPVDPKIRAQEIAQATLIVDTHIDVPYRLRETWEDVVNSTEGGDFDYERATKGGLNAPFMSIYTPAQYGVTQKAYDHAEKMIQVVERIVEEGEGKFAIATSTAEVEEAFKNGVIALPLGMENGSPIGMDLLNLEHFYERGIRYITLAHSLPNQISDSSYAVEEPNDGLSDFGHVVVRRMNQLGIMVDISHVSDKAFYDVMAATDVPAIASHSSARKFTPGFQRNMDDDMIRRLAEEGGVIMINYGSAFLTEAANSYGSARDTAYVTYLRTEGIEDSPEVRSAWRETYYAENPYPFATLDTVLDHIDHVVSIAGIDAVGIGSDYDGVGDSLPVGLKDVASFPNLIEGLLLRGYSEGDIQKILSGNLMRVWRAVEAAAATMQSEAASS